ncbi:hypothetical protein [Chromobacterium violaceum]|uniref:hypothetical protein n=1 Tax=Chromobacterium violaceum TaxID=536 RepID=UPI00111C852C|nr:hypothetical protein [Chromobacterium violaceum]QRO32503.1 hypothetical protein I6K04_18770 [Chromobacterium violaceum]QRQ17696.1 hypothetical protein I6K03_03955 [Chromobacterium violaceum]
MEKFTSSADKALAKKVFHAFTHQLLAQGSITEEDLKNTSHLFLKIKKILSKSTINMVIDYRENILKEAEALQKKKQYDFSIIYYAMFFEHSINGIITHQTEKLNLSTKSKMGIIKSTNIESKFTWILEILELPTFNSTHLKTIIKTSEIRNAMIHYKWSPVEDNPKKDEENEKIALISQIKKTITYMKKYETRILYNRNKSKLQEILKQKKDSQPQDHIA